MRREDYGNVFGENGSNPHINRSIHELIDLLGNKQTVNGRAARWVINELFYKVNEQSPMPNGPWNELEQSSLALNSEVKTFFNGGTINDAAYRNGSYYISELTEEISLANDSKGRAVTSNNLAHIFGDIDTVFKQICGETAYNELLAKYKNSKIKNDTELYFVKGVEESNEQN